MQGTWVVQLLNNGHVVPNSAQERATINAHPGVSEFLEDFFAIIWDDIAKAVAAYFGVASYDIAHAVALAKQIFGGSNKTYFVKGAVQLVESPKEYNQIQVIYKAWSEDEMKADTCKIVLVPKQDKSICETIQSHYYEAGFLLDVAELKGGLYSFIGGAQDDGWWNDVAISNQLDLHFVDTFGDISVDETTYAFPYTTASAGIAARYAILSTLMAEFGVDLGNPGSNSSGYPEHYNWAKGLIDTHQSTDRVRQALLAKLFKAFGTPLTLDTPKPALLPDHLMPDVQALIANTMGMVELGGRAFPKRLGPPPLRRVEIVPGHTLETIREYTSLPITLVAPRNLDYLQPLLVARERVWRNLWPRGMPPMLGKV